MRTRLQLTLLNWRYWLALPLLCVMFPVLVSQMLCRLAAIVFASADESIEYTFSRPAKAVKRFVQRNKQERANP